MKHIKASEFKAKCLKLMDEVQATGEEIVVTKNGVAVAKMSAIPETPRKLWYFGMGKGQFEIVGDIVSPDPSIWQDKPWPKGAPSKARRVKK